MSDYFWLGAEAEKLTDNEHEMKLAFWRAALEGVRD